MIKLGINKVKDVGSCNFCSKGVVKEGGHKLVYPYTLVYVLSSDENMSPWFDFVWNAWKN